MGFFVHLSILSLGVLVLCDAGLPHHVYCENWCHDPKDPGRFVCCIELGQSCVLNGKTCQSGDINNETCLVMQCNNGVWKYTGLINSFCGRCNMEGDPHVYTFDSTSFLPLPNNKYKFGGRGNFVITQNGFSDSSFGVNAAFSKCNTDHDRDLSCVASISYYEPGITVSVELPKQTIDETTAFPRCTTPGHNPSDDPCCQFTVVVHGNPREVRPSDGTVEVQGTFGKVLIFTTIHIGGDADLFCMSVVGSQGLSVSLCQHESDFAYTYIHSLPYLKNFQSQLYGLCNTYTGVIQDNFTARNGTSGLTTTNVDSFGESWMVTPLRRRRM